jgi:tRNA pseudouridine38-40 synthase
MLRYFLEVAYKGTKYSGFQVQKNANTIQAEVEKAFFTLQRKKVQLTGSSRTDAGVHALQNFFHFDFDDPLHPQFVYKLNAILPLDIVIKSVKQVSNEAHCRFDAVSREYQYCIYQYKNPFLQDRAYYYPYKLDVSKLNDAASLLAGYSDFRSFSKRNTQVKTFNCKLYKSIWRMENEMLIYNVSANRFLRGMVRALTATMLKVGRHNLTVEEFKQVIEVKDCTRASFAVPAHGLFLSNVYYNTNGEG